MLTAAFCGRNRVSFLPDCSRSSSRPWVHRDGEAITVGTYPLMYWKPICSPLKSVSPHTGTLADEYSLTYDAHVTQSLTAKGANHAEFPGVDTNRGNFTARPQEHMGRVHFAPWDLASLACLSKIHFGKFWYVCCYIMECGHKHGPDFYPPGSPRLSRNENQAPGTLCQWFLTDTCSWG